MLISQAIESCINIVMDNKQTTQTDSLPQKKDVIRALRSSPSREEVIMYEKGRAFEVARKLRELGSKRVTILVIE